MFCGLEGLGLGEVLGAQGSRGLALKRPKTCLEPRVFGLEPRVVSLALNHEQLPLNHERLALNHEDIEARINI